MRTSPALERILDRIEPDTIPSSRYNRVIWVGMTEVLELRDPNSGLDPYPESKPRHQYLRAGGIVWTRRLPPESVGDEWADVPGPVGWERVERPAGLIAEVARHLPTVPLAVLRRLRSTDGSGGVLYEVRGEYVSADDVQDVEVVAGPVVSTWWEVPLPPCPDCGGGVEWYEAGYVPGARRCMGQPIAHEDGRPVYALDGGCHSMFTVEVEVEVEDEGEE